MILKLVVKRLFHGRTSRKIEEFFLVKKIPRVETENENVVHFVLLPDIAIDSNTTNKQCKEKQASKYSECYKNIYENQPISDNRNI